MTSWTRAAIAAVGIALAAPAQTDGVTAGNRFTVDQDQGVFRAHAADINLTVVPALAAGGVTGEVNARHGTNDFRDVARRRAFADFIGGDGSNARCLQVLLGGGDNHGFPVSVFGGGLSSKSRSRDAINTQVDQEGQGFDFIIHCVSCFSSPYAVCIHSQGGRYDVVICIPVILHAAGALAALAHPRHGLMYVPGTRSLAAFLQRELFRVLSM